MNSDSYSKVAAPERPPPGDIVGGPEPGITFEEITVPAWVCSACGMVSTYVDGGNHAELAHPARRNPALTCHAAPMWDHERWCIRRKDHDGDHWTPSHGGGRWWPGSKPAAVSVPSGGDQ